MERPDGLRRPHSESEKGLTQEDRTAVFSAIEARHPLDEPHHSSGDMPV